MGDSPVKEGTARRVYVIRLKKEKSGNGISEFIPIPSEKRRVDESSWSATVPRIVLQGRQRAIGEVVEEKGTGRAWRRTKREKERVRAGGKATQRDKESDQQRPAISSAAEKSEGVSDEAAGWGGPEGKEGGGGMGEK